MAHELAFGDDGAARMMYVEEVPWHGLGKRLNSPPTAEEAIKAAGLDWTVARAPLFYHESVEQTGVVRGHYAIVPTEGWTKRERPVFGVVTEQYQPLQNVEAFSFFDPLIDGGQATYETAGALGEGERVWVLTKLAGDGIRVGRGGEDAVGRYLLLSNSHDGRSAVQVKFTPIRVVCNNTLTLALKRGPCLKVEHTREMKRRLELAKQLLVEIIDGYAEIEQAFKRFATTPLGDKELHAYLDAVFPPPTPPASPKKESAARYEAECERAKRHRGCCMELFGTWRNRLPGTAGTLWAAYNSVTEYVDHYYVAGNSRALSPSGRLQSMWFGRGSLTKAVAFSKAREIIESRRN
ncbi:MAG: hypothetical protein BWZ02_00869 [Lentisphaerae bacterium ADurb.BinA184]|nr:MAG: hypothetical protein BWZ02_00869 [Lentisphaerae bacterium ADurb.BinA184]